MWVQNTLIPAMIAAGVLLLVLWPTRHSGNRLLQTWGIAAPSEPQLAEAVRYLRQRRLLYVGLFLVVPPVTGLVWPTVDANRTPGNIYLPLLAAMLIAELVATLRPVSGVRVASLDRRTWRDLVPRWGVVVAGVLTVLAVAMAVLGLAAQPWADRYAAALPPNDVPQPPTDWTVHIDPEYRAEIANSTSWLALGSVALCLAATTSLVYLAVRRPAVADPAVDAALRTRTARVAVAIGFGWLGASVSTAQQRISMLQSQVDRPAPLPERPGWLTGELDQVLEIVALVTLISAVGCWMWLAMPSRRSLARVR